MFLVAIIDGYSRYVVYHDLRGSMEEKDVEIVVQKALDKFPDEKPRIISDHGSSSDARIDNLIHINEL